MSDHQLPIRPVIMCGGSGTRLWPASREAFPKQFAPIIGERSTFQETLLRFRGAPRFGRALVVTNKMHRFMVERQLAEIGVEADILLEPMARDSGPAVLASSLLLARETPGALALILAADHLVLKPEAFRGAVLDGAEAAAAGEIVTFGILPTGPATGYGYIEPGEALGHGVRRVERFVEKPDARTALDYVARGFLWNSGNFLLHPERVIAEYEAADPASVALVRKGLDDACPDLGCPVLDEAAFGSARKISFDFAIMEKTRRAAVVAGDFGWSDIGGWDALWDIGEKDPLGNVARGPTALFETQDSYVSAENQLVVTLGVQNLVVVSTRDALLVAGKDHTGKVKNVVEALREQGRKEAIEHARVYRPWGWYQTLELQDNFQVKRIVVYPRGRLSLQKHAHRAEHWVIVRGTARVTIGETISDLRENQSTYIPTGAVHRLENPGTDDIEVIEIQTGTYLGEDDIVRIEDDYRRA